MRTNKKTNASRVVAGVSLAGGIGAPAAKQGAEAQLRRMVMANLLWEDTAYQSGEGIASEIASTIPSVDAQTCFEIAVESREKQKLRHIPLFLLREMVRYPEHRKFVREGVRRVCTRPDQLGELLSIYWKTNNGKKAVAKQLKLGIADTFNNFDEYQLSKWNRDADVKLRDVMFVTHPNPGQEKQDLFNRLANNELKTPDTWEVGLSACKKEEDKREVWEDLITRNKLGALAVLRNLRNMIDVKVPKKMIRQAISQCSPRMLLPLDFIKAADFAPDYVDEINDLMMSCLGQFPKLLGETIFILDVSGSMWNPLSSRSQYNRMEAGVAMAMLAKEMCEHSSLYLTAGSDGTRTHKTEKHPVHHGFGLRDSINGAYHGLGGGGIFTRQCLQYVREQETETPDRIIVFSDSQDCDRSGKMPAPFAKNNYIVDVSNHTHGINYKGVWDAEISGWSENFLRYIAEVEQIGLN